MALTRRRGGGREGGGSGSGGDGGDGGASKEPRSRLSLALLLVGVLLAAALAHEFLGVFDTFLDALALQEMETEPEHVNLPRHDEVAAAVRVRPLFPVDDGYGHVESHLNRFQLHLSPDKPLYRPGDLIHIRGTLLDALTLEPYRSDATAAPPARSSTKKAEDLGFQGALDKVQAMVELEDSRGTKLGSCVLRLHGATSALSGSLQVPPTSAGGDYHLKAPSFAVDRVTAVVGDAARVQVRVSSPTNRRLALRLQLARASYAPGDRVHATLFARDLAHGGRGATGTVMASARLVGGGGSDVLLPDGPTLRDGKVQLVLDLPNDAESATLSATVTSADGAALESVATTVPLAPAVLSAFAEGGTLAAGALARVYVRATLPSGAPAPLEAGLRVVQLCPGPAGTSEVATTGKLSPRGRGRSTTFTVGAGCRYEVRDPVGRAQSVPVVAASEWCVDQQRLALLVDAPVLRSDATSATVRVSGPSPSSSERVRVALFRKDKPLAQALVPRVTPEGVDVELQLGAESRMAQGVLRATAYREKRDAEQGGWLAEAQAEVLLFKPPTHWLEVDMRVLVDGQPLDPAAAATPKMRGGSAASSSSSSVLPPGQQGVQLEVSTTRVDIATGDRSPVAALVGLAVTDEARRSLISPGRRPLRLWASALLATEVKLDEEEDWGMLEGLVRQQQQQQQQQLDELPDDLGLMLGLQGWRALRSGACSVRVEAEGKLDAAAARARVRQTATLEVQRLLGDFAPRSFLVNTGINGMQERMAPMMMMRKGAPEMAAMAAMGGMAADEAAEEEDDAAEEEAGVADDASKDGDVQARHGQQDKVRVVPFERVFAHARQAPSQLDEEARHDFAETVLVEAELATACAGERCTALSSAFALPDSVTTFAATADAWASAARGGLLGGGHGLVRAGLPVRVDVLLPAQVVRGDVLQLPVLLAADDPTLAELELVLELPDELEPLAPGPAWRAVSRTRGRVALSRGGRRLLVPVRVVAAGAELSVRATVMSPSGLVAVDSVVRTLTAVAPGFPVSVASGGQADQQQHLLPLVAPPAGGSQQLLAPITVTIRAFSGTASLVMGSLDRLIRDPCGCFEQTSSTVYPLVHVARLLLLGELEQQQKKEEKEEDKQLARAVEMLERGWQRLQSFEVSDTGGFEWFGRSPAHPALTAYGVVELAALRALLAAAPTRMRSLGLRLEGLQAAESRAAAWLVDGAAQAKASQAALDDFGRAPPRTSRGYVTWALLKAGHAAPKFAPELAPAAVVADARAQREPYAKALAAGIAQRVTALAHHVDPLLEQLQAVLDPGSGCVMFTQEAGASEKQEARYATITSSRGMARDLEATALAAQAWIHAASGGDGGARWLAPAAAACECLAKSIAGGAGLGASTQAVALGLEAIVAHAAMLRDAAPVGLLEARLRDSRGNLLPGKASGYVQESDALELRLSAEVPISGVELSLKGGEGAVLPVSVEAVAVVARPPSSERARVALLVDVEKSELREQELLAVRVRLSNKAKGEDVGMVVAQVGLPAGAEPRVELLQELVREKEIAHYELQAGMVTLYWDGLAPNGHSELRFEARAVVPGSMEAPASSAWVYYESEHRVWVPGLRVNVTAAAQPEH